MECSHGEKNLINETDTQPVGVRKSEDIKWG